MTDAFLASLDEQYPQGVNWQVALDSANYADSPSHELFVPGWDAYKLRLDDLKSAILSDPDLDLALLELGPDPSRPELDRPRLGVLDDGDRGTIVGGATSGDIDFVVTERTTVETDEVRGTGRTRRRAYVLAATTEPGDSGAGLFDDEGRLVGLLFAASTDEQGRSWATSGDEIDQFLDEADRGGRYRCDPEMSRLAPAAG